MAHLRNLGSTAILARYGSCSGGARLSKGSLLEASKLRLTVPTSLLSLPGGSSAGSVGREGQQNAGGS